MLFLVTAAGIVLFNKSRESSSQARDLPPFYDISSFAVAPDGKTIVALGHVSVGHEAMGERTTGSLRSWDFFTDGPAHAKEFRSQKPIKGNKIALSSDGTKLAVLDRELLTFWNALTGEQTAEVNVPSMSSRPDRIQFQADNIHVTYIADVNVVTTINSQSLTLTARRLPDSGVSNRLQTDWPKGYDVTDRASHPSCELVVWNLQSNQAPTRSRLDGFYRGLVSTFAVSADEKLLAYNTEPFRDDTRQACITLHDTKTGLRSSEIAASDAPWLRYYSQLAFSLDGQLLAAVGYAPSGQGDFLWLLDIYRVADQKRVFRMEDKAKIGNGGIASLTFSRDKRSLFFINKEQSISRIDLATFQEDKR
ncbi:WD40 repeat domain-containing protein [Limnoglobus roseus]|uniref:hypothetical protein n=1 Tax=Limnoglobus roseus TaxID=2598579 RepID=UPI0011EA7967|nr:hypothetical protein [Limnoglobus roseus]